MKSVWMAMTGLAVAGLAPGFQAAGVPAQPPAATAPAKGSIEGQVVNGATGTPLKKVNVRLVGMGGQNRGMPNMFTKETDEQGRFLFTGLEGGRYQLSAERTGFLRQSYGGRKYNTSGTALPLGPDQQVKGIVFKLNPQGVVTGKVLDEDGDPVANLQVRVLKYAYRGGKKQWTPAGNGQTSDVGEYRIPNLAPGRYLVGTNARNQGGNGMQTPSTEALPDTPEMVHAATYYPSTLDQGNAVPVEVGPGSEIRGVDIRLLKTRVFRIRGRVLSPPQGRTMVMVMLSGRDGQVNPAASPARPPDYRFEIRGVSPGSYVVTAQLGGENGQRAVAFQQVEVGQGHVDGVSLSIVPGNEVTGSVKLEDANGPVELPNLSVNLRPAMIFAGQQPRARVGEDRKFTLKNVAPMKYSINVGGVPETCYVKSIMYGGQEVPESGVDILGGGPIDITLSATAGDIAAAVVDKDSKPVPGAMIALIAKDGQGAPIRGNSTDEKGGTTFRGLKPGDYRLIAWEDIEPGAYMDPDFIKPFEGRGEAVKVEPSGHQAVQIKVIPASETDK